MLLQSTQYNPVCDKENSIWKFYNFSLVVFHKVVSMG